MAIQLIVWNSFWQEIMLEYGKRRGIDPEQSGTTAKNVKNQPDCVIKLAGKAEQDGPLLVAGIRLLIR